MFTFLKVILSIQSTEVWLRFSRHSKSINLKHAEISYKSKQNQSKSLKSSKPANISKSKIKSEIFGLPTLTLISHLEIAIWTIIGRVCMLRYGKWLWWLLFNTCYFIPLLDLLNIVWFLKDCHNLPISIIRILNSMTVSLKKLLDCKIRAEILGRWHKYLILNSFLNSIIILLLLCNIKVYIKAFFRK